MPSSNPLPDNLGGYQQIFDTKVQADDIVIPSGNKFPDGGWAWQYFLDRPAKHITVDGIVFIHGDPDYPARVYRKMPCPDNQRDCK